MKNAAPTSSPTARDPEPELRALRESIASVLNKKIFCNEIIADNT
jgi:hypothetical protein